MNYFVLISQDKEKGFSLIELVVVVSVLSVLSAIAIPAFNCFRRRAISTAAQVTIKQIKTECETNSQDGINTFLPRTLNSYSISANQNYECKGETIALIPDSNLYPTYFYSFDSGETSYNFKGKTGTSLDECNRLICNEIKDSKIINLSHPSVIKDSYFERECSAYVIVKGPSWNNAEANANSLGGNLVTINNKQENRWIANTYKLFYPGLYIGLTDQKEEGVWVWSSGQKSEYEGWDKRNIYNSPEPSGGDAHRENYGMIMLKFDRAQSDGKEIGGWHDTDYEDNPDDSWFKNEHDKEGRGLAEIPICD